MRNSDQFRALLKKGMQHASQGRYSQAIKAYDKAIKAVPDNFTAWFNKGNSLLEMRRFREALQSFNKVTTLSPGNPQGWLGKGTALQCVENYTDALNSYDKALAIDPTQAEAWLRKGIINGALERYEESLEYLDKALSITPNHPIAFFYKGIVYLTLDNLVDAVECFGKSVSLKPDFSEAWYHLSKAYIRTTQYAEALDAANTALSVNPGYVAASIQKGIILKILRKYDDAMDVLERTKKAIPDNAIIHRELGMLYARQGKHQSAIDSLTRAIKLDPNNIEAYLHLVKQLKGSDARNYIPELELLLHDDSLLPIKKSLIHLSLGHVYHSLPDFDRSFMHYEKANELMSAEMPYDGTIRRNQVARLITEFNSELLNRCANAGYKKEPSIFIIGLPRSGKTILEDILSQHSDVIAMGESMIFSLAVKDIFSKEIDLTDVEVFSTIDCMQFKEVEEAYSKRNSALCGETKRILSTNPDIELLIGIIHLCLPNAKFIHSTRNIEDNCFEIYRKSFQNKKLNYSHKFSDIVERYELHHQLLTYWKTLLPDMFYTVDFEMLVQQPRSEAKKILEFCGLTYESSCEEYIANALVNNRFPTPENAIDTWMQYANYLEPFFRNAAR
jgi:tetratricopeptide (TPR) repeat protein